jgi:ribosomal protein L19E
MLTNSIMYCNVKNFPRTAPPGAGRIKSTRCAQRPKDRRWIKNLRERKHNNTLRW